MIDKLAVVWYSFNGVHYMLLTDKLLQELYEIVRDTGAVRPALDFLCIPVETYKTWLEHAEHGPRLKRLIRKAKAEREIKAAQTIHLAAAEGEYRAALAVLESRYAKRWHRKAGKADGLFKIPGTIIVGTDVSEITK